jgi:hypothetical protein
VDYFVDSDDELMNRTVEIDFKAHKITGADVIEHKMLQGLSSHRICISTWREASFQGVDNNTHTIAMRKGTIQWIEICRLRIIIGEDKLQATALYFGYLYRKNVRDNSQTRAKEFPSTQSIVDKLIQSINIQRTPNSVNSEGIFTFCSGMGA